MLINCAAPNSFGDFACELKYDTQSNMVNWHCINDNFERYDYTKAQQPHDVVKYSADYKELCIILSVGKSVVFEIINNNTVYDISAWFSASELSTLAEAVQYFYVSKATKTITAVFKPLLED